MATTPTPNAAIPPSVEADLHTETAVPEAHHESGGLPQFDFAHWGGQIVYLLFLFVILYILIAKVFAPRLRRVLDERAETISSAVAKRPISVPPTIPSMASCGFLRIMSVSTGPGASALTRMP